MNETHIPGAEYWLKNLPILRCKGKLKYYWDHPAGLSVIDWNHEMIMGRRDFIKWSSPKENLFDQLYKRMI